MEQTDHIALIPLLVKALPHLDHGAIFGLAKSLWLQTSKEAPTECQRKDVDQLKNTFVVSQEGLRVLLSQNLRNRDKQASLLQLQTFVSSQQDEQTLAPLSPEQEELLPDIDRPAQISPPCQRRNALRLETRYRKGKCLDSPMEVGTQIFYRDACLLVCAQLQKVDLLQLRLVNRFWYACATDSLLAHAEFTGGGLLKFARRYPERIRHATFSPAAGRTVKDEDLKYLKGVEIIELRHCAKLTDKCLSYIGDSVRIIALFPSATASCLQYLPKVQLLTIDGHVRGHRLEFLLHYDASDDPTRKGAYYTSKCVGGSFMRCNIYPNLGRIKTLEEFCALLRIGNERPPYGWILLFCSERVVASAPPTVSIRDWHLHFTRKLALRLFPELKLHDFIVVQYYDGHEIMSWRS